MGLYASFKLGLKRNIQEKAKQWFPTLTKFYGFADGPLNEDVVDEIIYIEGGAGSQDRVLCRNYADDRSTLQEHLAAGTDLEDALEVEGGVFKEITGDCVSSYSDLFDPDFDIYDADKAFLGKIELGELSRQRKEFVEDQLRLNKRFGEEVGHYKGSRVLVAHPPKNPIRRVLSGDFTPLYQMGYFGFQSFAFGIYRNQLLGRMNKLFGVAGMEKLPEDAEAKFVDYYKTFTAWFNNMLGLPKEIEAVASLA